MATIEIRKIAIDEVVESAATGVLRALDARAAAAGGHDRATAISTHELVKSGFFVDFIIRCGGRPGPLDIGLIGGGTLPKGG